jgi:tetratricopeptide (TPR) repeat protein
MSKYNPNKVITEANEKLTSGDYNGGQFLFQSALLQWTDDAREDHTVDNGEAIATLWLAYTQYLIQGNQFKSASDAFEEAMDSCPQSGRIFAEAARYAVERNKRTTAQKIYLRAVRTIVDEQDQDLLWNDFLEMKREEEPNLTMKELKEAIQNVEMDDEHAEPSQKKPKLHQDNKTHVVTKDEVDRIAEKIDLDEMPEDIMLAWLSFDGSGPPQRPPMTLFSPSPPKLSDPVCFVHHPQPYMCFSRIFP